MDYRIESFEILLSEDCILQRYYPLIPYKRKLIENLKMINCTTKSECVALDDQTMINIGLPNMELVKLFRRFLSLYDSKADKLREIKKIAKDEAEEKAFQQLYLLPGVKATRAKLYYEAGYSDLDKIAGATVEQIICDTTKVINKKKLELKAPLPKEVRTHIAVAKAFSEFSI